MYKKKVISFFLALTFLAFALGLIRYQNYPQFSENTIQGKYLIENPEFSSSINNIILSKNKIEINYQINELKGQNQEINLFYIISNSKDELLYQGFKREHLIPFASEEKKIILEDIVNKDMESVSLKISNLNIESEISKKIKETTYDLNLEKGTMKFIFSIIIGATILFFVLQFMESHKNKISGYKIPERKYISLDLDKW